MLNKHCNGAMRGSDRKITLMQIFKQLTLKSQTFTLKNISSENIKRLS